MAGFDQFDRITFTHLCGAAVACPSKVQELLGQELLGQELLGQAVQAKSSRPSALAGQGFPDSLKNASARTGCHSSGRTLCHAPPIRKMIGETCVRRR